MNELRYRNLILFGPPGAGKGAQSSALRKRYPLAHLSTGEVIREEIKNETARGLTVKAAVENGKFADDETVLGIILERIDRPEFSGGFILDGFPRSLTQASMLEDLLADRDKKIHAALCLKVPDDVIVERLSGRRICADCDRSFHVLFKKPRAEGVCDDCGGKITQRKDDEPAAIRERLRIYHEKTEPLLDFYERVGSLVKVDGDQTIEEVTRTIESIIREP